jgi:hypothetical protein
MFPQDFFGHEYDFVRVREVFIFSFPFFIFDIEKKNSKNQCFEV